MCFTGGIESLEGHSIHYCPLNVNIQGKKCVVIGGGNVAERKVKMLLGYGARVVVVSPQLNNGIRHIVSEKKAEYVNARYKKAHIQGAFLVVAATDDMEKNKEVARDVLVEDKLVNVVDYPGMSNFTVPSVVTRGDLTISISTNGKSPALAKKLRRRLENEFGEEYMIFLNLMGVLRREILNRVEDPIKRKEIFNRLAESNVLNLIREHRVDQVSKEVERCTDGLIKEVDHGSLII